MPPAPLSSPEDTEKLISTLQGPTEAACAQAVMELPDVPPTSPEWEPQQAPGSAAPAATDARKVWAALHGWSKLAVPSEYEDIEGGGHFTNTLYGWRTLPLPEGPGRLEASQNVVLPDEWQADRHYHHAWYILNVDFGSERAGATWLRFDAVAHACVAFVNGKEAGRHIGGYTPFAFDITALLRPGKNMIALWVQDDTAVKDVKARKAISQLDCGRGVIHAHLSGIRGGVYLEARHATHVDRIRIRPSTRTNTLNVETWIGGDTHDSRMEHAVYEWPNGTTPVLDLSARDIDSTRTEDALPWADAKLWSPEHPNLYVLRTTVTTPTGSESIDTRFGFREFWIEGSRFMLNGKPIRLFGDADMRKELASIVPEVSREYDRKTIEFLKHEFNFNALRLHGQLFPVWSVLAADEAGCLVTDQSGLRFGGRAYYQRALDEFMPNTEREFEDWYWRDVNSPSVVIWDVENELIRGQRTPELQRWVLELDTFIKKLDPNAIVEHSGAGWYPGQEIIHVHMQEQYNRIMRTWQADPTVPLVMGEFWMGGRGETRLPNGYEYSTREEWHHEEARIYREQMLEMRNYGVCGIMPHRLTHWPVERTGPMVSRDDVDKLNGPVYTWRFESVKNLGGRGLAPIVGFVWPRGATVVVGEPFTREVVVCNDREVRMTLHVRCTYGEQCSEWDVTLDPADQHRRTIEFIPSTPLEEIVVDVCNEAGDRIEGDRVTIHAVPRATVQCTPTSRRIVVVPHVDDTTATALEELDVTYTVSDTLPTEHANKTIVLVPPGTPDDALGRSGRALRDYLAAGGRLLALPQHAAPRWLPSGFPFGSAVRSSIPEFDQSGWDATNKDLIYSREVETYAPGHPAFAGLAPCDFKEWHPVDGRISDDVFIRPNAVNMTAGAAYRVLLGATRRENASLMECMIGGGTAVLCQAQVLNTRSYPAARALLFNLLRYLDGPAWRTDTPTVGLLGDPTPELLATLTGADPEQFTAVTAVEGAPSFILAGDHADTDLVTALVNSGRTVLVLSCETAGRLPGYGVEQNDAFYYSGTRRGVADDPLFWGIASASFLPLGETPARGALARTPADVDILLAGHGDGHAPLGNDWTVDIGFYGLEAREPCPPLAVRQRCGNGTLVTTTIEPWDPHADPHRQLLCNLLANAGVPIPDDAAKALTVEVKRTVPLQFDGKLDDWTNDMEDINLSRYVHADPIALTSKDAVEGNVENDLAFSGIVYFLYDEEHLYIGGAVFPADPPTRTVVHLADKVLQIDPANETVTVAGAPLREVRIAAGQQPAGDLIDARLLNLSIMHRQTGKPVVMSETPGGTFEVALPWAALDLNGPPERLEARLEMTREDGCVLQQPVPGAGETDHVVLRFHEGTGIVAAGEQPGG